MANMPRFRLSVGSLMLNFPACHCNPISSALPVRRGNVELPPEGTERDHLCRLSRLPAMRIAAPLRKLEFGPKRNAPLA